MMREAIWIGSSLEDLRVFPTPVRESMGYALYLAQNGGTHPDAKPMKGFSGAGLSRLLTIMTATRTVLSTH